MPNKRKFIKIKSGSFSDLGLKASKSNLRSTEHYLQLHNNEYNFDGEVLIVSVNDKLEAIKIGLHLNLYNVEYFDGLKIEKIDFNIKPEKMKPVATFYKVNGKEVEMNKYKRDLRRDTKDGCLSKSEIIRRKIITKGELEKAIKEKKIMEIKIGRASYIRRVELAKLVAPKFN